MKYSVVIPTYNHCEKYLKPCIESILKYSNLNDIELIVSANGCKDETKQYINYLCSWFEVRGLEHHFRYSWSDEPLGYAKATNAGLKAVSTDKIVLLNNDTILLEQNRNQWLEMLEAPFLHDPEMGISGPIIQHSPDANSAFCVFFCVMLRVMICGMIRVMIREMIRDLMSELIREMSREMRER